jgi:hypothetical protein
MELSVVLGIEYEFIFDDHLVFFMCQDFFNQSLFYQSKRMFPIIFTIINSELIPYSII